MRNNLQQDLTRNELVEPSFFKISSKYFLKIYFRITFMAGVQIIGFLRFKGCSLIFRRVDVDIVVLQIEGKKIINLIFIFIGIDIYQSTV